MPNKRVDKESLALANNPRFARIIKNSRARHAAEGGVSLAQVYKRLKIEPLRKRSNRRKAS